MASAYSIKVRGVVQGVGFRPFVYRLARANRLAGWVLNAEQGVEMHLEGSEDSLQNFIEELRTQRPRAASMVSLDVLPAKAAGFTEFTIRESHAEARPTVRISPDLPVCDECLGELFDSGDPRYQYPYINCTNCGPRYTVIRNLPYDRANTTMAPWLLDELCSTEYDDPANRRFHAQPVACPECGPHYYFRRDDEIVRGDDEVIRRVVRHLHDGEIVAVKGLGGYHLCCDAKNREAVEALRTRKYRKEKPFALMVRDVEVARELVELVPEAEMLLESPARPIVLAPARIQSAGIAPDNDELGVMLPYTPLHHLLFAAGAPAILVMTSANRSSEPIAYQDAEAIEQLAGIADAFCIGERPIARRVDDSVARAGVFGPAILRRARGYAPGAVSAIPPRRPILALGADLKNTITLVVDGQAFVSQHIGDLDHYAAFALSRKLSKICFPCTKFSAMNCWWCTTRIRNTFRRFMRSNCPDAETLAVQHHRAHIASVLAERGAWDEHVIGVSFDGTGYGDDGTIWGGEIFAGSVAKASNASRICVLRRCRAVMRRLRIQVQAAAGYLAQLGDSRDFSASPFHFPSRYHDALPLMRKGIRTFTTTSMGRLFDTAAALLGFTREVTFEGQAAMWLEHLAHKAGAVEAYPFPFSRGELDFRPLLRSIILDRVRGREPAEIARAFHRGIATGLRNALIRLCGTRDIRTVALSGGVFQNELLLRELHSCMETSGLRIWTNNAVPANDGGISLGQAALAAFAARLNGEIDEARDSEVESKKNA